MLCHAFQFLTTVTIIHQYNLIAIASAVAAMLLSFLVLTSFPSVLIKSFGICLIRLFPKAIWIIELSEETPSLRWLRAVYP